MKPTITERLDAILGGEQGVVQNSSENKDIVKIDKPNLPEKVASTGNPERDLNDDFEVARSSIYELIGRGKELTDSANYVAKEKQDSRSIEAAALAQKEARDSALALIDLHQKKADIQRGTAKTGSGDTNIQNNAVFVGTTGELLKLTRDLSKNSIQDALKSLQSEVIDAEIVPVESKINTEENNA